MSYEKKVEVKTIRVTRLCEVEECIGTMVATGVGYATLPPTYEHKCDACGNVEELREQYPHFENVNA